MRIAYICYVRAFSPDGVNQKITRQVSLWREAGHEVELFAVSQAPATGRPAPALPARVFPFSSFRERALTTIALVRCVRTYAPDVVYLRYDRYVPPLPPLLRRFPIAVEVNTDDTLETRFWGRLHWIYNELNRRLTFPFAAGFVPVSRELAEAETFTRFGKPSTVIANGADLDRALSVAPQSNGRVACIMLVGSLVPWVGTDKVVELARRLPELDVHVVGCSSSALGPIPANVSVHPSAPREEYRSLLAGASFGVGPLAVHRKGMHEASPLKVRDYLANGLPVLIAHDDTDFPGPPPWFVLRIPNDEDAIKDSVAAIRAWIATVSGRRVGRDEIEQRLDMRHKEAARLAFLEALVGRDRSPATE